MSMIWHFPLVNGGDDEGVNESGVWQFEGNRESSVTRECIQNSLDAHVGKTKPVTVRFSSFMIDRFNIPMINDLEDVINRAKAYNANEEKANEFYEEAVKCISAPKIRVLKISDYNTTGLDGGDTKETAGRWYHLVWSTGSSPNRTGSGGSFGIGKSAPFAASTIRTVFYSTMLEDDSVAFQGKTRLSSFKDDNNQTHRGFGRYGIKDEQGYASSIRDRILIPNIFERIERGTDVLVIGYKCTEEWKKRIIEAVVKNFYVAILENNLEVIIEDEDNTPVTINAETIAEIIDSYIEDEETILYYQTMVDPKHRHFEETLPGLGKVEMFVRIGEGKKRIQGMRQTLMKIHEFTHLRKALNDEYTGVVIVRGDEGNDKLRALEPPAHDVWDSELGKDNEKEALKQLRDWVWNNLKSISNENKIAIEEIPDLSKYLPQDMADDDRDPVFSNNGNSADEENDTETANEKGIDNGQTSEISFNIKDRIANITKPGTMGGDNKKQGKNSGHNGGKSKLEGAGEPEGDTGYADVSSMASKTKELLIDGRKVYQIAITPEKDDSGSIRIIGIGDGQNYPLDILRAHDECGNELEIDGEKINDLSFKANQTKIITIELKSSRRYVVGVA